VWAWTASTFLVWPRAGRGAGEVAVRMMGVLRPWDCQWIPNSGVVVRDSDSPLVWVAQKPRGGSPGPPSAGVYLGDGCCQ